MCCVTCFVTCYVKCCVAMVTYHVAVVMCWTNVLKKSEAVELERVQAKR